MSEAEAVRIARVFSKYDRECGGRGGLDRGGVKRLCAELGQPLTDEEAKLAMSYLDEDGNGLVDFGAFAR
jgi:Ca2+-binding EF-hand superfamily protein